MDENKDVSRRYRELPREEPPPALDARIRAEAKSALETHAAPLVAPTGRRNWYFPAAAAAVIMLAVGVAWQVDREQPVMMTSEPEAAKEPAPALQSKVEEPKPQERARVERLKPAKEESLAKRRLETAPAAPAAAKPAPAQLRAFTAQPKDQVAQPASSAERSRDQFSRDNRERQERPSGPPPAAAPPASEPAASSSAANAQEYRSRADLQQQQDRAAADVTSGIRGSAVAPAPQPQAPAARAANPSTPDVAVGAVAATQGVMLSNPAALRDYWLEQIAELRKQGRDEDADKALAEFRKRYPDYKIPPETLKKVERSKESEKPR
jgi:Meckel syndrome type 1 protein